MMSQTWTNGGVMTNDLEKIFFDTFGIEPKCQNTFINPSKCPFIESKECCDCVSFDYPQISDRILLELICIDFNENPYKCRGGQTSVDEVKERILSDFIHEFENDLYLDKENIKHQVRTLFGEG